MVVDVLLPIVLVFDVYLIFFNSTDEADVLDLILDLFFFVSDVTEGIYNDTKDDVH